MHPHYNVHPQVVNVSEEHPRTPRRTPMACQFCRGMSASDAALGRPRSDLVPRLPGRKLKCDGSRPSCGNCNRRGFPCVYVPVYVTMLSWEIRSPTDSLSLTPSPDPLSIKNSPAHFFQLVLAAYSLSAAPRLMDPFTRWNRSICLLGLSVPPRRVWKS